VSTNPNRKPYWTKTSWGARNVIEASARLQCRRVHRHGAQTKGRKAPLTFYAPTKKTGGGGRGKEAFHTRAILPTGGRRAATRFASVPLRNRCGKAGAGVEFTCFCDQRAPPGTIHGYRSRYLMNGAFLDHARKGSYVCHSVCRANARRTGFVPKAWPSNQHSDSGGKAAGARCSDAADWIRPRRKAATSCLCRRDRGRATPWGGFFYCDSPSR